MQVVTLQLPMVSVMVTLANSLENLSTTFQRPQMLGDIFNKVFAANIDTYVRFDMLFYGLQINKLIAHVSHWNFKWLTKLCLRCLAITIPSGIKMTMIFLHLEVTHQPTHQLPIG